MTAYVALLRAVNVGGTGKLAMSDLKALCADAGFDSVATYIASGNVVFTSPRGEQAVKSALERRLRPLAGKPVGVIVRTADEMRAVELANPFAQHPGNRVAAIFLDEPPPKDAIERARHRDDEEMAAGVREIYVHYGAGMGRSRLVIPAAADGTARNMNTVAKLAAMAGAL